MRAIIQRVSKAEVVIDGLLKSSIKQGLLIFLGIKEDDSEIDIQKLVSKVINMRIFADQDDKMNQSVLDCKGEILLISQFTLYGNVKKGNRPSFIEAAKPEIAKPVYEKCIASFENAMGKSISTGTFGADMQVTLTNDGPVTIWYDTLD
jgi:D-tyrosyl-tRNA(Tyr) deacylase